MHLFLGAGPRSLDCFRQPDPVWSSGWQALGSRLALMGVRGEFPCAGTWQSLLLPLNRGNDTKDSSLQAYH